MNHSVISILPLYENIRLHKHQQEIIETYLQVLKFLILKLMDLMSGKTELYNRLAASGRMIFA